MTRVKSPPARPLMIFDGDCRFCAFWIRRWQRATGEAVEYIPFQDPKIASQFPVGRNLGARFRSAPTPNRVSFNGPIVAA